MALEPGTSLGHYDVTALIGEGGMGQVYRARDTKLDRDVALKILPETFVDDPERLARFQREAKVLASLNHPNIAAIYGLEDSGETHALVLELVEGPTLQEIIIGSRLRAQDSGRTQRGRVSGLEPGALSPEPTSRPQGLPLDETLPIAKQIAEALEAAHEQGIIHRDLKPANIKVTPEGVVKVLDFGLAKALEPEQTEAEAANSPTMTAAATKMGVLMGTAAYMSPEQARGKPVDKRADIWAFGVVLLEMVTGQKVFEGEDVSLTLSRVLQHEPNLDAVPPATPPLLRAFLQRCLQKDPKQRIRDIGDVRLAMEGAFESVGQIPDSQGPPDSQIQSWPRSMVWAVGGCVTGVAMGIGAWNLLPADALPDPSQVRFAINRSGQRVFGSQNTFDVSPDGSKIVFTAPAEGGGHLLHLRSLNQFDARPLAGTEGATNPFFSPDGEWVAYADGAALRKVALAGGEPVFITEHPRGLGADWGMDDTIVLTGAGRPILRVSAVGATLEPLTSLEDANAERTHRWPEWLPNGKGVLFTVLAASPQHAGVAVVSLESGERWKLFDGSNARYASTGHIVFARGNSLWAVAFDAERLEVTGEAIPVLEGVQLTPDGSAEFALATDGSLGFVPEAEANAQMKTPVWIDRQRREEVVAAEPRLYESVTLSPDGTRLIAVVNDSNNYDLWISELERGGIHSPDSRSGR